MKKVLSALKKSFSLSGSAKPDSRFAVDAPPAPPQSPEGPSTSDIMPPPPPPPRVKLAAAGSNGPDQGGAESVPASPAPQEAPPAPVKTEAPPEDIEALLDKAVNSVAQKTGQAKERVTTTPPDLKGTEQGAAIDTSGKQTKQALDDTGENFQKWVQQLRTAKDAKVMGEEFARGGGSLGGEKKPVAPPEAAETPEDVQAVLNKPGAETSPANEPAVDEENVPGSPQGTVQVKPGTPEYDALQRRMADKAKQAPRITLDEPKEEESSGGKFQKIRPADAYRKAGIENEVTRGDDMSRLNRQIADEQKELQRAENSTNKLAADGAREKLKELEGQKEQMQEKHASARRREEVRRGLAKKAELQRQLAEKTRDYWTGKANEDLEGNVNERARLEEELEKLKDVQESSAERPVSGKKRERMTGAAKRARQRQERARRTSESPEVAPAPVTPEVPSEPRDELEALSDKQLEKMLKRQEKEVKSLGLLRESELKWRNGDLEGLEKYKGKAETYKNALLRGPFYRMMMRSKESDFKRTSRKYEDAERRLTEQVKDRNRIVLVLENRLRDQLVEPEQVLERTRSNVERGESLVSEEREALNGLEVQLKNLEDAANDPKRQAELMDRQWRQQMERIRGQVLERRATLRGYETQLFGLRAQMAKEQSGVDTIKEQIAEYVRRSQIPDRLDILQTPPPHGQQGEASPTPSSGPEPAPAESVEDSDELERPWWVDASKSGEGGMTGDQYYAGKSYRNLEKYEDLFDPDDYKDWQRIIIRSGKGQKRQQWELERIEQFRDKYSEAIQKRYKELTGSDKAPPGLQIIDESRESEQAASEPPSPEPSPDDEEDLSGIGEQEKKPTTTIKEFVRQNNDALRGYVGEGAPWITAEEVKKQLVQHRGGREGDLESGTNEELVAVLRKIYDKAGVKTDDDLWKYVLENLNEKK